jgi:hypothetical protein
MQHANETWESNLHVSVYILVRKSEGTRPLGSLGVNEKIILKSHLSVSMWTGLNWLKIGSSGRHHGVKPSGFPTRLVTSWPAEILLASQEGFRSAE